MTTTHNSRVGTAQQWAGGLVVFAAVMLAIDGVLQIFRGITALSRDVFVTTPDYVFKFNLTAWGWTHIILGAVAVVVSLGLFQVALWARICGVVIAGLIIIANFLSLPYYPVWSVVMIALSGFVIWALCVVKRDDSYAAS
ncbi:DUF7144 family membrane protein [Streptomyces minutiscleroticus]|uniref:DUF7144 domain-containing protein n=1 Tax=Streptomyces minutiscleroticus TaxID=68238 RepID=A0A918NS71_9ACTN|nr:hypothetical protein [Streptomyces minutiscleroticus]GGX90688.1 hypothetical protein GCM10010358_50860 [Streptomyces minutiscleroticus]